MQEYISVIHVYHRAEDEIAAIASADDFKISAERELLDTEDGEALDVVQTIPLGESPDPAANVMQLRRARNILIRTRSKENYTLACAVDEAAHTLKYRSDPHFGLIKYDYSNMMNVLKEVIDGNNPLDH